MIKNEINALRAALGFLTLIPILGKEKFLEASFAQAVKYFSLVGFVFGFLNLVLLYAFKNFFFDKVALFAILFILIDLCLSGALHLDGLMDSFDGIAASKATREETLIVMKDSRVGAFGAIAGILVILSKFVFLSSLDYSNNFVLIAFLLFLLPMMSRFMMILALCFQVKLEEAQKECSSLLLFKQGMNSVWTVVVNLITVKIFAWSFLLAFKIPLPDLIRCDLILVPWMILAWFVYTWLKYKLKGHNGDTMGGGLVMAEVIYLVPLIFI